MYYHWLMHKHINTKKRMKPIVLVKQNLSIYRGNDDKQRRKEELVKSSWLCNKESNDKHINWDYWSIKYFQTQAVFGLVAILKMKKTHVCLAGATRPEYLETDEVRCLNNIVWIINEDARVPNGVATRQFGTHS